MAAAGLSGSTSSSGGASPDSYIGSLISLTSNSEIRYEGVLYTINTDESSIGLRNVRSFGTEGRKKDGPQLPASDRIYEYILFRGSDIKDLQVKSSPTVQPTTSLHNDPAIIQSHYSRPPPTAPSMPPVAGGTVPDLTSHAAQPGIQRAPFPGSLPSYQPGGSLPSWGSTPAQPPANGSGLAMPPMYWQGYYPPSGGFPHLPQSSLLRPPPGLAMPQPMQQLLQYPSLNTALPSTFQNLPEFPSLMRLGSANLSLSSDALPSAPASSTSIKTPEPSANQLLNKSPSASLPLPSLVSTGIPPVTSLTSNTNTSVSVGQSMPFLVSNKPITNTAPNLANQTLLQPVLTNAGSFSSTEVDAPIPLVTPGHLLQSSSSAVPSSQSLETSHRDIEIKKQESKNKPLLPDPNIAPPETKESLLSNPVLAPPENKEPLLPAPKLTMRKPVGPASYGQYNNRGRGRGRGNVFSRPVTKFTEEFDFTAMNEKFNKDEVWGHLGKNKTEYEDDDAPEDDEVDLVKEVKPVYVKDDFFDLLSSTALDRSGRNGRTKFSEQMKIDTETFGDFPRHRPMPMRGGGRGPYGGGGGGGGGPRGQGSNYGRGYGYVGRGRGRSYPNY